MRNYKQKKLSGVVCVSLEETRGDSEKLVRRFIKKVKNDGIIDEVRERRYHKKPSVRRREDKARRERLIQKENKRREELLKPRDRTAAKRKRR